MAWCGRNKKSGNEKQILEDIRSLKDMNLAIKLNDLKLIFDENSGDWKTNLNDCSVIDDNFQIKKESVLNMKEESLELDKQLEVLEKEYLAKVAKLLIMAQVHCEIKTDINYIFDELGVSQDD